MWREPCDKSTPWMCTCLQVPVSDRLKTNPLRTYTIWLAYYHIFCNYDYASDTLFWFEIICEANVQVRLALTISPDMEIPVGIYSKTTRYLNTSN